MTIGTSFKVGDLVTDGSVTGTYFGDLGSNPEWIAIRRTDGGLGHSGFGNVVNLQGYDDLWYIERMNTVHVCKPNKRKVM